MRARTIPITIVCVLWGLALAALVCLTFWGGEATQAWLLQYGVLVSAMLAAAITSIYVVFTYEQMRAAQMNLKVQYGAGISGPRVDLVQEDRDRPPGPRIPDAYQYPAEYRRRALPHRADPQSEPNHVEVSGQARYEMIRVANRSQNTIEKVSLILTLEHDRVKKTFEYEHADPIEPRTKIEIAVWPVQDMPTYRLHVAGSYVDAIGSADLEPCEVQR